MNEIMTGSVDSRSVVSKMTLALLEDSGWYKVNYSMAGDLRWGRYQGEDFVSLPCNHWRGAYHCNTTQVSGCTYNREAEGYCPILSYNGDLPPWAQYFPQSNRGTKLLYYMVPSDYHENFKYCGNLIVSPFIYSIFTFSILPLQEWVHGSPI